MSFLFYWTKDPIAGFMIKGHGTSSLVCWLDRFVVALGIDMGCDSEAMGCHRDCCVTAFCIFVNNLENF